MLRLLSVIARSEERRQDGQGATATTPRNGPNKTTYSYTNKRTGSSPVTGTSLGAGAYTCDALGRIASTTDGAEHVRPARSAHTQQLKACTIAAFALLVWGIDPDSERAPWTAVRMRTVANIGDLPDPVQSLTFAAVLLQRLLPASDSSAAGESPTWTIEQGRCAPRPRPSGIIEIIDLAVHDARTSIEREADVREARCQLAPSLPLVEIYLRRSSEQSSPCR